MKNYFAGWKHTKNAEHQNISENADRTPTKEDSLAYWHDFISKHSWKDVLVLKSKFVPCALVEKDDEIWNLLCQRLIQIEQPVVSVCFINEYSDRIIWVDCQVSNQMVKNVVAQKYSSINKPCFVLETSGKLRGFALSEKLVIAGASAIAVFPHAAVKKVMSLNLSFLTKEDSSLVETNFWELNQMMRQVSVPGCCSDWMIADEGKMPNNPYEGYDVHHPNRFTYYEHDDFTIIFAKL